MGYYTYYTLSIENEDELSEDIEYRVAKALARLDEFRCGSDDDPAQIRFIKQIDDSQYPLDVINWDGEIKWYDHEEDMMEIAAQFPECIFIVDGAGEDLGDQWRMYLHGDKFFKTWAKVTYEKPDWM